MITTYENNVHSNLPNRVVDEVLRVGGAEGGLVKGVATQPHPIMGVLNAPASMLRL